VDFFKGNLLAISKHIPATLFQFYIIDDFKKLYLKSPQEVDLLKFYFASIYASTFSTIFTYPIDLVQTRYTAHNVNMPKLYPSIWRAFAKIRSEEKTVALFRGVTVQILASVPYQATFILSYQLIKKWRKHNKIEKLNTGDIILYASISNILAQLSAQPFNVVTRRFQVQTYSDKQMTKPIYKSVTSCFHEILQKEGILAFFKGSIPAILRTVTFCSAGIFISEILRKNFITNTKKIASTAKTNKHP